MRLKRLVTTLNASFESFVNGVENHDALAQGVIADVRKAAARLRSQKGALEAQTSRLRTSRQELTERRDRWHTRAQSLAQSDPEQALLCLRRRDAAATQLVGLTTQIDEQSALGNELSNSLLQVEQRLAELQNRRTALSSREAKAAVLAQVATPNLSADIDDLFSRWEVSVLEDEYRDPGQPAIGGGTLHGSGVVDELDDAMRSQEADELLRDELAQMRNSVPPTPEVATKENDQ